jgi:hypothetical protein
MAMLSPGSQTKSTLQPQTGRYFTLCSRNSAGALERALHGALVLRDRKVVGGGDEWFRTGVDQILTIYHALLGEPPIPSLADHQ